jgi:hypothetical protein
VASGPETSGVIGDVIHDVVLADGEAVKVFGANAYVQEGPLTTASCAKRVASIKTTEIRRIIRRHPPTLRAVPVDGAERAFGTSAG